MDRRRPCTINSWVVVLNQAPGVVLIRNNDRTAYFYKAPDKNHVSVIFDN
jgi:hypothetical protein